MALSEAGERLFPRVKAPVLTGAGLERDIRADLREPVGTVTLGSLPSIGTILTGRLFAEVRAQLPCVNLRVLEGSSGQVEEGLTDSRVDIAILYRYTANLPEGEEALATVDSYLIGHRGDRVTADGQVPFASLDGLPFILPGARCRCEAGAHHPSRR